MSVFTQGQDDALQRHLEYCSQVVENNERAIEMFESGKMRLRKNQEDISAEWVATLKRQNEALRATLTAFEPARFQSQVK